MTLEQAKTIIKHCAEQMHVQYKKMVFDEWAIVSLQENRGKVLGYIGPRREGFRDNFATDAGALRAGLMKSNHVPGDYEFNRHAVGTGFEAYMVLGDSTYLICNNTVQHMDAIAKDPLWLSAQVPFVELSEKFRENPLTSYL